MKWASTLQEVTSGASNIGPLLKAGLIEVEERLGGQKPDLVVGFVAPDFMDEFEQVPAAVARELAPKCFIGCSAGGLIGGWKEVEKEPAVAFTAAVLPDVEITPFHVDEGQCPDLDDPPGLWEKLVGIESARDPAFILLPDPFSLRIDTLVSGLDFAFPGSVKVGGLASGASRPGANALFLNSQTFRTGAVGVGLSGNLVVETVVAQGCRPIGTTLRVTKCDRNILYELDGMPAVAALHEVLAALSPHAQELARHSLFLGVAMDEFKDEHNAGDFLIRNILGLEPVSGALVVGEVLRNERTVQFHLRDAATSADDLRFMLKRYVDTHERNAAGALLFSCLGRGQYLYGIPNHDSDCFREYVGEIPLGGFFCNGEIGPVGGSTFLHGYTSSFGIFREKEPVSS